MDLAPTHMLAGARSLGCSWIDHLDGLDMGALFSPCRRWRYLLWRRWDPGKGICVFVGLNPSTASETEDDPTIRRCKRFAQDWGFGALWMLNAYAFRATDPAIMKRQGANALGPQNNEFIVQCSRFADLIVAAWGAHCEHDREVDLFQLVTTHRPLHALGLTKHGSPRHPLYLRADSQPQPWAGPGVQAVRSLAA